MLLASLYVLQKVMLSENNLVGEIILKHRQEPV